MIKHDPEIDLLPCNSSGVYSATAGDETDMKPVWHDDARRLVQYV